MFLKLREADALHLLARNTDDGTAANKLNIKLNKLYVGPICVYT